MYESHEGDSRQHNDEQQHGNGDDLVEETKVAKEEKFNEVRKVVKEEKTNKVRETKKSKLILRRRKVNKTQGQQCQKYMQNCFLMHYNNDDDQ
jgi:hypothetical protein